MIIKALNKAVRQALKGIEGRQLVIWHNELNDLLEEFNCKLGKIEFINFLYDGQDLSNEKVIPIFEYLTDYYNGLFEEQTLLNIEGMI